MTPLWSFQMFCTPYFGRSKAFAPSYAVPNKPRRGCYATKTGIPVYLQIQWFVMHTAHQEKITTIIYTHFYTHYKSNTKTVLCRYNIIYNLLVTIIIEQMHTQMHILNRLWQIWTSPWPLDQKYIAASFPFLSCRSLQESTRGVGLKLVAVVAVLLDPLWMCFFFGGISGEKLVKNWCNMVHLLDTCDSCHLDFPDLVGKWMEVGHPGHPRVEIQVQPNRQYHHLQ